MFQTPIFCSQLVRHLTVHHFPDPCILLRRFRPSFPVGHLPDPAILRNVVRRFQVVHFQSPKTGEINRVRVAVSVLRSCRSSEIKVQGGQRLLSN